MKKLLTLLGSFIIFSPSLSSVISCQKSPYVIYWEEIQQKIETKIKQKNFQKFSELKNWLIDDTNEFFNSIEGLIGIQSNLQGSKKDNVKINYSKSTHDNENKKYEILIRLELEKNYKIYEQPNLDGFYSFNAELLYKYFSLDFIQDKILNHFEVDEDSNKEEINKKIKIAINEIDSESLEYVSSTLINQINNTYQITLISKEQAEIEDENENRETTFKQRILFTISSKKVIEKLEEIVQGKKIFEQVKNEIRSLNSSASQLVVKGLRLITFEKIEFSKDKNIIEFVILFEAKDTHIFQNKQNKIKLNIKTDVKLELVNKWFKVSVNRGNLYVWYVIPKFNYVKGATVECFYDSDEPDAKEYFVFKIIDDNTICINGIKVGERTLNVKYGNSNEITFKVNITYQQTMHYFEFNYEGDYNKVHDFNENGEIDLELITDFNFKENEKQLNIFNDQIKDNFKVSIKKKLRCGKINNNCTLNIKYVKPITDSKLKQGTISLFPFEARTGINLKYKVK